MPARRFASNIAGVYATAGAVAPTISGMSASSTTAGQPISNARDGNANTYYASLNNDALQITIPLTSAAKILWISEKTRADAVSYLCIGKFDWYYSDNGSTWTLAQSGCTFPGYTNNAIAGGATVAFTPTDAGAHAWWQIRVTNTYDAGAVPGNYVEFAEIAFATDAAGTQLISGV